MGLYQIHFVTPGGEACGELVAAYPLQLAVRVDPVRKMLIYDACDFLPVLVKDFMPVSQGRAHEVCTAWSRLTSMLSHDKCPVIWSEQDVRLHPHMLQKVRSQRPTCLTSALPRTTASPAAPILPHHTHSPAPTRPYVYSNSPHTAGGVSETSCAASML